MERNYDRLLELAGELGQYSGYLDTAGKTKRAELVGQYTGALRGIVYGLLKEGSTETAVETVNVEIDAASAHANPQWRDLYEQLRHDLLARIERDGKQRPWQRFLIHRSPLLILALLAIGYFGVRLYAATPVRDPVQTRAGLEQRAAALDKLLRYNDWASVHVRKGGFLKPLLLWPIEPSDAELAGAQEMADVINGAGALLVEQEQACRLPLARSGPITSDGAELLKAVTAALRAPGTRWRQPAMLTILDPIRSKYPC